MTIDKDGCYSAPNYAKYHRKRSAQQNTDGNNDAAQLNGSLPPPPPPQNDPIARGHWGKVYGDPKIYQGEKR